MAARGHFKLHRGGGQPQHSTGIGNAGAGRQESLGVDEGLRPTVGIWPHEKKKWPVGHGCIVTCVPYKICLPLSSEKLLDRIYVFCPSPAVCWSS